MFGETFTASKQYRHKSDDIKKQASPEILFQCLTSMIDQFEK